MEMVSLSEEAHSRKVRVFRWNEKLRKNGVMEGKALFMFRISNKFITINHQQEEITRNSEKIVTFERIRLLSDDSIKSLALDVLNDTNQFLPNTIVSLAHQISTYLISQFRFSPKNLLRRNLPRIVIVVDVDRSRTANYGFRTTSSSDNPIPSALFPPPSLRCSPDNWSDNDELDEEFYNTISQDTYEDPIYNWDLDPDPELFLTVCSLRNFLYERGTYPLKPIATDEPVGLFEVDPEKDHVWVRTKDDDRSNAVAVAVGVCPICLDVMLTETEEDIVVETCCLHVFHKGCISRWLFKSNSCPICRLHLQLL